MKVLLVTHGTRLSRDRVASGNSVRAYALARGLTEHGFEVVLGYPQELAFTMGEEPYPSSAGNPQPFDGPDGFADLVERTAPDVLIVGFWRLLELVRVDRRTLVVLDLVAPSFLEAQFDPDRHPEEEARRMLELFRRADRFLCGTERQRHLLLPWLMLAGFDCRQEAPIDVLPISAWPTPRPRSRRRRPPWRLVTGGVRWPWRASDVYLAATVRAVEAARLDAVVWSFSSRYVNEDPEVARKAPARAPAAAGARGLTPLPLLPYGEMERFLVEECDIGLELAERNLEREYSSSYRSMEWLRCGLPVVCNDYLDLAEAVRAFGAGWVVSSPEDLAGIVRELARNRGGWEKKRAGARRLASERLHYRRTIVPLVRYLRSPRRPPRGPAWLEHAGR